MERMDERRMIFFALPLEYRRCGGRVRGQSTAHATMYPMCFYVPLRLVFFLQKLIVTKPNYVAFLVTIKAHRVGATI